jgi:hypothetical protein
MVKTPLKQGLSPVAAAPAITTADMAKMHATFLQQSMTPAQAKRAARLLRNFLTELDALAKGQ